MFHDVQPAAKRTAKNSVFLDLFQDKKNLPALYKTLHSEDTDATEDTLDIVTIDNVLTEVVTIMMSLFDNEQIMKTYWKDIEKGDEHGSLCNRRHSWGLDEQIES